MSRPTHMNVLENKNAMKTIAKRNLKKNTRTMRKNLRGSPKRWASPPSAAN